MKNLINRVICLFLGHYAVRLAPDAPLRCVHCNKQLRRQQAVNDQ